MGEAAPARKLRATVYFHIQMKSLAVCAILDFRVGALNVPALNNFESVIF